MNPQKVIETTVIMRALSWKQPYGSLMLPPFNKIETRTWRTNYRGAVLLCASKVPYSWNTVKEISGNKQFNRILDLQHPMRNTLEGHAFAVGELVECRPMEKKDEDQCFVQFHSDLYCHVYQNVKPIKPIPFKGKQGWSWVPQDITDQIQYI